MAMSAATRTGSLVRSPQRSPSCEGLCGDVYQQSENHSKCLQGRTKPRQFCFHGLHFCGTCLTDKKILKALDNEKSENANVNVGGRSIRCRKMNGRTHETPAARQEQLNANRKQVFAKQSRESILERDDNR